MANILLLEKDASIASFLKRGFGEEGYYVDYNADVSEGLSLLSSKRFDIIIIDIEYPKISGLDVCSKIRKTMGITTPILMITSVNAPKDIAKGLEIGVSDYIVSPFKFGEILARVAVLLQRNQIGVILTYADLKLDTSSKMVTRSGKGIDLTVKEYKMLEYFLENPCRVITRTALLEEVWDKNVANETNIVDVYINYLRKKIDKGFNTKLIHTVVGMGYVLKEK